GIIGKSGQGKSTLLALILGLIQPTKGDVLIDNKEPERYFNEGHTVGYVGPDAFLFKGSLRDNLLYGNRNKVDDSEIIKNLREASLGDLFDSLPEGLDTLIPSNGDGFSAGQKQRLAFARALCL